jgi:hypothetical protein
MRAIEKTKVPYMVLNTNRCRCTLCPAQADSECIQEKYSRLENELESLEELKLWSLKRFPEFTFRQVLLPVAI